MNLNPYIPGDSHTYGAGKIYNLSANENPLGASDKVCQALAEASRNIASYPDGGANELRQAIARKYGLNAEQIICGNGSDELISLLANTYIREGDEAIYSQHGFIVYPIAITAAGGRPVVAPEKDLKTDVDAILAKVSPKTRLVFLANPNNPTGSYLPFDEVVRLQKGLPSHVLLVLDAAYAEYVSRNDYAAGIELVSSSSNVVMTRTFSKIYGLAGLRLGWLFAPSHIIDILNRVRAPYNINSMALAAGIAAIHDDEHIMKSVVHNARWIDTLSQELSALGLVVTPSVCNFLLVHFPEKSGKSAREADRYLRSHGLIPRMMTSYGLPEALRISIGTEEANRKLILILKDFLKEKNTL